MLLALIAATQAAEVVVEGTPDDFVATRNGAVLGARQFMYLVGDPTARSAYDLEMAQARRRARVAWAFAPLLSVSGGAAVVYGYSDYEPLVMAVGSVGLFGGPILATVGGMRFAVRSHRLHQVQSWYTYEQAVAWSGSVSTGRPTDPEEAPRVGVREPITLVSEPHLVAYQAGAELPPADFAWAVGDSSTFARVRSRQALNGIGGGLLVVGGLGALALSSVANDEVAPIPATLGVVGLLGGGAVLTVGRRRFQDLERWYEPGEAEAWAVTPGGPPS